MKVKSIVIIGAVLLIVIITVMFFYFKSKENADKKEETKPEEKKQPGDNLAPRERLRFANFTITESGEVVNTKNQNTA